MDPLSIRSVSLAPLDLDPTRIDPSGPGHADPVSPSPDDGPASTRTLLMLGAETAGLLTFIRDVQTILR